MNTREIINIEVKLPNSVFSGQSTYSSLFLPPVFDLNVHGDVSDYLINAYTNDAGIQHVYTRPLFVLLATNPLDPSFKQVNTDLLRNRNCVYSYCAGSYKDEILYMYVLECPDEYREDYDKFSNGQYSKFSSKLKARFARTIPDSRGQYVESPLYGIIYKTPTFKKKVEQYIFLDPTEKLDKEQEYFGTPSENIEIFRHE
jgi:hypothetical protein